MDVPLVRKIGLLKDYLKVRPHHSLREGSKVIDIGGICEYYDLLRSVVSPSELYLLNIERHSVRGCQSIVANALQLPFCDEAWDAVISFELVEHLTEPASLLSEVSRILRSDGLFILSTPNLADIYSRITFLLGYNPFNYDPSAYKFGSLSKVEIADRGHKSVLTFRGTKGLLGHYGFRIEKSYGYSYIESLYRGLDPQKKERIGFSNLRRALGSILPVSLSEGMLFICKKV
ncbi:MAG: class I SAM-dependent methyltransferase [Halobacteriota archaeon]|jgi:SAM-dependent methyltransferase